MTIALTLTKLRPHWLQCADCKGYFDPNNDQYATVDNGYGEKTICINCVERAGDTICNDCGDIIVSEILVQTVWTYYRGCNFSHKVVRCEDCAEEAGWTRCWGCNEWLSPDDQNTSPGNDTYCEECFDEHYTHCTGCGEVFDNNGMMVCNDELYCMDCAPDRGDFEPGGFERHTGCTTEIGSERCYGIELETDYCADYDALENSGAWGAKDDCTVSGKEFYSDILDGDEGLDAVAEFAEFARLNDWRVEDDCGYHLHIDMRNESDDSLFATAYAYRKTQEVWVDFVDSTRRSNTYSHPACWTVDDLDGYAGSFVRFILDETRDRYEWVNLRAYTTHTTFEVRLHHGSVDGEEICNWVKAHTRFVDWAATVGYDGVKEALEGMNNSELFDFIAREVWQDSDLRAYYAKRSGNAA